MSCSTNPSRSWMIRCAIRAMSGLWVTTRIVTPR
ncbi:MAG: ribbon-helix-helix domain-containing protein [Streptosporangiaceae bacterium]